MDRKFVKESVYALLPILVVCALLFILGKYNTDFWWHISYNGNSDYPPMMSVLLSPFGEFKAQGLFILNLVFSIYVPFCLIYDLKGFDAARFFLYSGIPIVSFALWVVPQSIILCLMLACLAEPGFLISFVAFGWLVHSMWWAGFILMCAYGYYRRKKNAD